MAPGSHATEAAGFSSLSFTLLPLCMWYCAHALSEDFICALKHSLVLKMLM